MEQTAIIENDQVQEAGLPPGRTAARRGKTLWNASFRLGAQFLTIFINLLVTPFIIRNLGVESYGVVGVMNTIISYMVIATSSFTSTVGRNLTFSVERGEADKANKELSTAVFGIIRIFCYAFIPLLLLSVFIDKLIIIPPPLVSTTRIFFIFALFSFGFTTISGPIGAAMFVRNRLDLFSAASLGRTVFFVVAVILLFTTAGAGLVTYGIALVSGSILIFLVHLLIHHHLLPDVEISPRWFDRSVVGEIVSLGGWMTVAQIGGLLFLQTDLIVANRVLGPTEAGQLAAISIVSIQIRSFAALISGLFAPNQTALAARGDWPAFQRYLFRSVRITTIAVALLVGTFCGTAREVLSIWLGPEYGKLAPVAIVLNVYLVLSLGASPVANALLALGKIKLPAIITVVMGVINVILSVFLANRLGLIGIAISGSVNLTLRNVVFTPWLVSRVCTDMRIISFLREMGFGLFLTCSIFAISSFSKNLVSPSNLKSLILTLAISTSTSILLVMALYLLTMKINAKGKITDAIHQ